MGLISLLVSPVTGGPRMVHWIARIIQEEAQRERSDETGVRGALLGLQQLFEAGELTEEEYDRQEVAVLERLNAIRELKTHGGG